MENSSARNRYDISIILPPSLNSIPVIHVPSLPAELLEQINRVYLLHALATNSSNILPTGKSLLSLITSRNQRSGAADPQHPKSLKDQVSDVVTRAFWDEALESLSSPTPAVQLTRLRLLYEDIHAAVAPLVPPANPIMYTLSNPLSPTSSPLRSAAGHLRVLLSVLRERCAPIRDVDVDILMNRLHDLSSSNLPRIIVDTVRGVFNVTDNMKGDLAEFVVGTWTEQEARTWIRQEAVDRERRTVLEVFSVKTIQESYHDWLGPDMEPSASGMDRMIHRLIDVIGTTEPVSLFFSQSGNALPPPFLFVTFDLVKIQNLLQALVITASLLSLVRPVNDSSGDWLSRIWALLEIEVEKGGMGPAEVKLLHLEDEVVQAAALPGGSNIERRLREAVQRTLKPQDPVFMLLQARLLQAIRERLTEQRGTPPNVQIPGQMRTGRGILSEVGKLELEQEPDLIVKGFGDAILRENIKRLVTSMRDVLGWMKDSWGQFLFDASVPPSATHETCH